MIKFVRRVGAVASGALLGLMIVSTPAWATTGSHATHLTVSVSRSATPGASVVKVVGKVSPRRHGGKAELQTRAGKHWRTVQSARLSRSSRYSVSYRQARAGRFTFRVHVARAAHLRAANSRPFAVTVAAIDHRPVVHLDNATSFFSPAEDATVVELRGWALDIDQPSSALTMSLGEGATLLATQRTAVLRSDINAAYHTSGTHGFDFVVPRVPGSHALCLSTGNVRTSGTQSCVTVTVATDRVPVGVIEAVTKVGDDFIATGWAYDPDNPGYSVDVHLNDISPYNENESYGGFGDATAGLPSADINAKYHLTGAHRFSIKMQPEPHYNICASAHDLGYGGPLNGPLGCVTTPTTPHVPVGYAAATVSGHTVHFTGYAFDPDDPSASATVRISTAAGTVDLLADKPSVEADQDHGISGQHGFDATFDLPAGGQGAAIDIVNVGAGRDTELYRGHFTIT